MKYLFAALTVFSILANLILLVYITKTEKTEQLPDQTQLKVMPSKEYEELLKEYQTILIEELKKKKQEIEARNRADIEETKKLYEIKKRQKQI